MIVHRLAPLRHRSDNLQLCCVKMRAFQKPLRRGLNTCANRQASTSSRLMGFAPTVQKPLDRGFNSTRCVHRQASTSSRLIGFDAPTVWQEFTPLSNQHKSVNLGQGFPDWQSPDFVKKALCDAVMQDYNQYSRSAGDLSLVEALSKHYSPLVGRKVNPLTEITIGVGATEVMFAVMQSLLNEGDEVIVLEPAFDTYPAQVQMAGGICKFVPLELNEGKWTLDMGKLEETITPKTKIMLLNTPHNPSGKVLSQAELEDIASILRRHPHVTAVMDEVYEKLVYGNKEHLRLASLPGIRKKLNLYVTLL
jgi:aspartate/methionine/tyrosine aminotransferase